MTTIETRIDPVEINDEEPKGLPEVKNQLLVAAHWVQSDFVVLEFQGKRVTVEGAALERAIRNAMNH